jgi:heme exporter protein A
MNDESSSTSPSLVSSSALLKVCKLTRAFGEHYALIEVDAEFKGGEITALLGPNGAGKSTLMNLLSTLMAPSEGDFILNGQALSKVGGGTLRHQIGYVGHHTFIYGALSAFENLMFFGRLYGINPPLGLENFVKERLSEVGLKEAMHRKASGFSRGMAQRLTLARALLPNPQLLLLDEPFTGLDQQGIEQVCALIEKQRQQGSIIILSSHDLSLTDRLYQSVLILKRGRTLYSGGPRADGGSLLDLYQEKVAV